MINVQAKKEKGHNKSYQINSIEEFTDDPFTCDCRDGMIESWEFTNDLSAATELLMDSLMLGLTNIVEAYGEEYLKVEMVEK